MLGRGVGGGVGGGGGGVAWVGRGGECLQRMQDADWAALHLLSSEWQLEDC